MSYALPAIPAIKSGLDWSIGSGAYFVGVSPAVASRRSVITISATSRDVVLLWAALHTSSALTYVIGDDVEWGIINDTNALYGPAIGANSSELPGLNYAYGYDAVDPASIATAVVVDYQAFVGDRADSLVGSFLGSGSAVILDAEAPRNVLTMGTLGAGLIRIPTGTTMFFACTTVNKALTGRFYGAELYNTGPENTAA